MPFIDSRLTIKLSTTQKEELKCELGRLIETLHKSEKYLMVEIKDDCDLWLGGIKLIKGAYLFISLFGNATADEYNSMTSQICDMLSAKFNIPGNAVYITYHPVNDWGWNGKNF